MLVLRYPSHASAPPPTGWTPPDKPPTTAIVDTGNSLASGLIGLWLFNEGSGSVAADYVNGNDAQPAGPWAETWLTGDYGDAISTQHDYWHVDNGTNVIPATLRPSYITVHMIARWPNLSDNGGGFATGDNSGVLFAQNGGSTTWNFYRRSGGWANATLDSSTYIGADTWRHVTMTYDGSSILVYVDGTQRASASASGTLTYSDTGQPTGFGKYYDQNTVHIAYCAIWDRALSGTEVADVVADPYQFVTLP